jgi:TetR/AcrR family transcriptional regulator
MVIKTRARTDSAKEQRRAHLLGVARDLFLEHGMGFSMLEVAQQAKLAKGTTYLYFATKEEVLLALLTQELEAWFAEFARVLDAPTPQVIANSISSRPILVRLLALQASILEHNLSFEAALGFKNFLAQQSATVVPKLQHWLPKTNGLEVLQILNALVIGLAQLAHPSPTVQKALEQEHLAPMHLEFETVLERSIDVLWKGFYE